MKDIIDTFRPDLFAGKDILVTGGSSGIGLAIAQGFARLGGSVIALGSSETKLKAAAADPQNEAIRFERVDVRDPAAINAFARTLSSSTFWSTAQALPGPSRNSRTPPTWR